jgi:hypothetical protein
VEFFFGDESTQKGARDGMGKLVAFGGVFVSDDEIKDLDADIDAVAKTHKIPRGTELKWSPPKNNWIRDNLVGADREQCYRQVLEAAATRGVRALVVLLDTGRTTVKGDKAFEKALDWSWERIEMHLATEGASGVIVADRPGGKPSDDEEFLEAYLNRMTIGTDYVKRDRVLLNILTTPSHLVRGLQLADLVTGITTAAVAGNPFGLALVDAVTPLLITNSLGTIGGTGLKLFPDSLVNLYHHALGETVYAKAAYRLGYTLPLQRWSKGGSVLPYATDPMRT